MASLWQRERPKRYGSHNSYYYEHSFEQSFADRADENIGLDTHTKLAVLKVSESIVGLVSYSDGKELFVCSGTIIECEESNGTFLSTILTSASLIRSPAGGDLVVPDIRVDVFLLGGKLFKGNVFGFDFHYNISVIKIISNTPLPTAILKCFDDSMPVKLNALHESSSSSSSFQLHHHVDKVKLRPQDKVVALGRHYLSFELMAAPGEFSVDWCEFDCQELSRANCKISKNGIGGPLINYDGRVIGINFYYECYTPFLPINIASKCLEDLKKYGRVRHPWIGAVVINLHVASANKLEKIIRKFPNISKGLIVEEVEFGSPAYNAQIRPDDVIIQCNGNFVGSSLEFVEIMWDKAGKSVEVVVMRASIGASLNLTFVADETNPDNYYRWPVPEKTRVPLSHRWS